MTNRDMDDVLLTSDNDAALARAVGVNRSTISRWRKNPDSIPVGMYRRLARIKSYRLTIERVPNTYA